MRLKIFAVCLFYLLAWKVPPAAADIIPTGNVSITSGRAGTGTLADDFFISGDNFNIVSTTPDGGLASFALNLSGNTLATTIPTYLGAQFLGLPCTFAPDSFGTFNGVSAQCLHGSMTFTSSLTGPCVLNGRAGCSFTDPQETQSSPFVASGNISGWNSTPDGKSTEAFDVSVTGQGSAIIGGSGLGFFTDYTFADPPAPSPTPEPSTFILLGSGLLGLLAFGRRRLKRGF